MTFVTFREWLQLSAAQRAVLLDAVLERLPEGYFAATDVGHAPAAVPQYLHRATSVMFHLVFGDEVLLGMTPQRLARVAALRPARESTDEEYDLPRAVPDPREVQAFSPARRVVVAPLLVGEVLSRLQLNRLGVPEELLANSGVRPAGIGAAVRGLTARGWRAPSEAEWEFVARAAADSLDDVAPPTTPADRLLSELGNTPELCRDSWHPTWEGAPHDASPWGDGHEVTRGGGHGTRYTGWTASPAWTECVWPSRSQIASSPRPVRVRPVVGLPRE